MITSVENPKVEYRRVIKRVVHDSPISMQLCEFKEVIYKPGSIDDRLSLVEKTIKVLEDHKCNCENGEGERVVKAQCKLNKIITHTKSKRLAPGQIPSVYEIAIWEWIN